MKFIIYAMICIADLSPYGMSCMNYSEPKQPSYTHEECQVRSEKIGNEITEEFMKQGVPVIEHIVWCVEDKRKTT